MDANNVVAVGAGRATRGASPRLSRRVAFWAVAGAFLTVAAFSTAPSSLYGLYEHQEHLSALTITVVYAVYAVGVVATLVLAGHISDWYGRRAVLLPAVGLTLVAALVFLFWRSLAGLIVGRLLTGAALGAAVATATAYVSDLDSDEDRPPSRRAGIVATIANIGGLAVGPLITGVLASYAPHPLTLPFVIFAAAVLLALVIVFVAPEGRAPIGQRPAYHPQRFAAPAGARAPFIAATTGTFLCFAVFGLFSGLAGRFLAGPLHHSSPALAGAAIFLTFGAGVVVQTTTVRWSSRQLIVAGVPPLLVGLCLLVLSAWTSPASLATFLLGGVVAGAGGGAIFRGSLSVVIAASHPDERAGALATFFVAGYAGVSLPVVGVGLVLQQLSPRVTLLIFGLVVALGIVAATPLLLRPAEVRPPT